MNLFGSILSNGLGFNNLKDLGKGMAGNFLTNVLDRSIGSLSHTAPYGTIDGDMKRQKQMVKAALRIMYAQGWQWTVEVDGFTDFQMFAKELNYSPITIESDSKQIGGCMFNLPTSNQVGQVTITVRDTGDEKIKKWFTARAGRVINGDGTFNEADKYLMGLRIYSIQDDGSINLSDSYDVYPGTLGDISRGRDQISEFLSYPLSFTIYSSFSGETSGALSSMASSAAMGIGKSIVGSVETQVKNLIKF